MNNKLIGLLARSKVLLICWLLLSSSEALAWSRSDIQPVNRSLDAAINAVLNQAEHPYLRKPGFQVQRQA